MRYLGCAAMCTVALLAHGVARAQGDSDLDLLYSQKSVPPNIAILLDDSGSMAHALWPDDFDPDEFHDDGDGANACSVLDSGTVDRIDGTAGLCPGSGDADYCPDNNEYRSGGYTFECDGNQMPLNACSLVPAGWGCNIDSNDDVDITPPDYTVGTPRTRWSKNYLAWIVNQIEAGTQPVIPASDRLEVAKDVVQDAIDAINPPSGAYNENARFGLFGFDRYDHGASLKTVISDTGSRASLFGDIDNMRASNWTPLAESLVDIARYMMGNDAIGTDPDLEDGSVISGAPIDDASCAQNFVIVMTDGEPTQDDFDHSPFSGGSFTSAIGDADASGQDPSAPAGVIPYEDNGTDWFDDVAYYLYHNDLRPEGMTGGAALPNTQNVSTYVIGFNIDHPLLSSAAANGNGKYFSTSSTTGLAAAIENAIQDILLKSSSFSSASIPSTRTGTNDALFTAYFEPSAEENFWPGHLEAYAIGPNFEILRADGALATDATTGEFLEPRDGYYWDAQFCLSDPNAACHVASRVLYHNEGTPFARTDFTAAELTASEVGVSGSELGDYPNDPGVPFANAEDLADAVVNYVRGVDSFDQDRDTDATELREYVMGDIFHSSPLAMGPVSPFLLEEDGYGPVTTDPYGSPVGFFDRYYPRSRTLYVGANDGMLHAFHGGDQVDPDGVPLSGDESYELGVNPLEGSERFGYVPNAVLPTLKNLVKTGETKPFFVDGSPIAADAWLGSSGTDVDKTHDEWATVLVTGLRNGGKGYLALDVTDPAATALDDHGPYPKFLWELSDPNELLGYTWSDPVLTRVKLRAGVTGDYCGIADDDGDLGTGPDCRETWVAIFAAGYLKQGDPSLTSDYIASPSDPNWVEDSRAIYMVDLRTGGVISRIGYDAADAQLKYMTYSIPTQPAAADLNSDGFADIVYFGDIGGQMWKWDISAVATPDGAGEVDTDQWPVGRFFTAPLSSNGHRRQIFYPPSLSMVNGHVTLGFGTGERTRLDYDSAAGVDENHFYVIRDLVPTGSGAMPASPYTIADLTQVQPGGVDSDPSDLGFYLAAGEDEKFVTSSVAFGGFLVTASYSPDLNANLGPCEQGGSAYLYIFSLFDGEGFFADSNGTQQSSRIGSGLPSSPRISRMASTGQSHVVVQTSRGELETPEGPKVSTQPVDLLFWRTR